MSLSEISAGATEETPATSLRRAIPLLVVLLLGVAFSAFFALVVRHAERERFETDFDRQAQIEWRAMQVAVQEYEECLHTLRDLFDSSEDVNAEEFKRTAADLRTRHSGLELLAWIPRVRQADRAAFEGTALRVDGTRFFIHDGPTTGADFAPLPAPERTEYLPMAFCDPAEGNEKLFGFDQRQGPYVGTIERAIETGTVSATQRVTLGEDYGAEPGWASALAVYAGEGRPRTADERATRLRGMLASAVPFSSLVANTVGKLPSGNVDLMLLDESGAPGERFLIAFIAGKVRMQGDQAGADFRAGLHRVLEMPVAGRQWIALFRPSSEPMPLYPWAFLAGGMVLTGMLMALLHSAQQRTVTVQRLVQARTAELHATQRTLHEDNQRRRKAEEQYRAFVEQSNEAIWRFEMSEPIPMDAPEDAQIEMYYRRAILAEANDAFAQMYGYERAKEMIGLSLANLMPREPATFEHLRQYVRSGYRLAHAESHEVGRNGVRYIFLNNMTGIVENGRLMRVWGTQRDVTEQRRAEDGRRVSELRLRNALAAADLGTWEWDVAGDSIVWSVETEEMFGFPPGGFRGGIADYLQLVHPDHRGPSEERMRRATREGGSLSGELRIIRRDGSERWIVSRGDVMRDESGRVVRLVGVVMDVTEQHLAAEEKAHIKSRLQETQKLESLGILAGGVAHDFNNLLTGILGNTNIAQMDLPLNSPVQTNLTAIEKTSHRAAELCRQMLAYSGKGRFVVQRLDVSEIAQDTVQLVRPSLGKNVVVEAQLPQGLPAVSADATQIRQIIMNLLINASDALGESAGVITVRTGCFEADAAYLASTVLSPAVAPGKFVFLEVGDTGCGMSAETLAKIFHPFFSTKFTGRGLGLAAVLGIVRGHGGAMKVSSEVGRGSNFRMLLPATAHPAEARAPEPPARPAEPAWRGSGKVLVADDEQAVRIVASRLLSTFGYQITLAANGREAVELFRKAPADFAAVLLDLTMPVMDGIEAFTEIRGLRPEIPVVLMSGYNEQDALSHFAGQGLAGFVQKPFSPDELRQAFRDLRPAGAGTERPSAIAVGKITPAA